MIIPFINLFFVSIVFAQTPIERAQPTAPSTIENMKPLSQTISGFLYERGTKIPLSDVNIFILPHKIKAVSDKDGHFTFINVPIGEIEFVVNLAGYEKLTVKDQQKSNDTPSIRKLYLEKITYSNFETRIVGNKNKIDGSQKTLTQKEFLSMPGANGDPIKAVQNLPGINRAQGFSSQVVIQGSAPKDTAYDIDGHRIPLVFHFGGLTSVIIPEALEQVDYLSAGYSAYYSRALGGIISLKSDSSVKLPRKQKGFFFIDTLKSGGMFETQIDDTSSILIGGRMSYIGFILNKAFSKNDNFNLTVAPEFSDFTMIHKKKLNDRDDLKTIFIYSKDTLGFLFKEPFDEDPAIRGSFKSLTQFYRIIPQWKRQWDDSSKSTLSIGYGTDTINTLFGTNYFNLKSDVLSVRGDWTEKIQPHWSTQIGFDNIYRDSKVITRLPKVTEEGGVSNPIGSAETVDLNVHKKLNDIGLYWKNEIQNNSFTYVPALRWDLLKGTNESLVTPKFEVLNQWDESLKLRAAWGLYVQEPEPQELSEEYGNPEIKAPRSQHSALGFEKDFREGQSEGWVWNFNLFHRNFSKLVIASNDTVVRNNTLTLENVNNKGSGRAYGFEMLFKFDSSQWKGWIAYTYSKSTRISPPAPETLFEYDQTHSLNLIFSKPFGKNWTLASRYRFTTGNPFTPVVSGVLDSDSDVYIPIRGGIYSRRYNNFKQLDLRLDKKWIGDEQIWSLYLDIQNILNQPNSENLVYSYNYQKSETLRGLPLIPTLGVKGEF